jgi:hypothetical protein
MKSSKSPYEPLRRSLRFWAYHTGYSVSLLSRAMKKHGWRVGKRTANPGATLREVWTAIDYR